MIRHHVLITLHDDAKDTVADQIVNELATYGRRAERSARTQSGVTSPWPKERHRGRRRRV